MEGVGLGTSLTPEQELDSYKEKVERFKVLIRKLQEDVQTNKVSKEGTETMSKLLQESKQEVAALMKKQKTYEAVIRNLQSRLEANGLSSDVLLQEGETYIPVHSQRLVDNMTRENNRLRQLLRSKSGDPEELARFKQSNEELHAERLRLQKYICELEGILQASDNQKDQVVKVLREQLQAVQQQVTERDALVHNLCEESRMLQKQLMDVAHQCQELARKLTERSGETEKVTKETLQKKAPGTDAADAAVMEENKQLKKNVEEITQMNLRWQKYNTQREETVKNLDQEVTRLKNEAQSKQQPMLSPETEVEMNRILDESRRVTTELENAKRQASRLAGERDRHRRDLENAQGQINALKQELEQLRLNTAGGTITMTGDSAEIINALKAQIQICTEDFESERRDRERVQAKRMVAEAELEHTKKELENCRRMLQQAHIIQSPHNDPAYHFYGSSGSVERLAARGHRKDLDKYNVVDGQKSVKKPVEEFTTKGPSPVLEMNISDCKVENTGYTSLNASSISSKDSDSSKDRLSPRPVPKLPNKDLSHNAPSLCESPVMKLANDESLLTCPKCNRSFTKMQHPEFLEHFEDCCD